MTKKMPAHGQSPNRDSMSVDGTNAAFFEDLMSDVSEEDQQELREGLAQSLERSGLPAFVVELMRNPQPFPVKESDIEPPEVEAPPRSKKIEPKKATKLKQSP